MPDRALGAPGRFGILDQPSARHRERHERGQTKRDDEPRAHELMIERGRVMAKEVPDGAKHGCPDRGAREVKEHETADVHRRDAGNERDEHSHNRNEAAEQNRAGAVPLEEVTGPDERAAAAVCVAGDERGAATAEIERGGRPRGRRQCRDEEHERERQMTARGERRCRHDRGVGRKRHRQPLAEQEEDDQRVAVVRDETDEMCCHDPGRCESAVVASDSPAAAARHSRQGCDRYPRAAE